MSLKNIQTEGIENGKPMLHYAISIYYNDIYLE